MKRYIQYTLWPALAIIVIVGVLSVFYLGPKYAGKTWFDTEDFKWQLDTTYEDISVNVLNRIDLADAEERLNVTPNEIEEYRNYYGTLSEQLDSIESQYRTRIDKAKEAGNEKLLLSLVKERDGKMEDIEKNFHDDEHVMQKIRQAKVRKLESVMKSQEERYARGFAFAYDFEDPETGERFTKGDVSKPAAFKKQFNETNGYFRADSIAQDALDYGIPGDAAAEPVMFDSDDLLEAKNPVRELTGTFTIPKDALEGGMLYRGVRDFNMEKWLLYGFWVLSALSLAALLTVVRFRKDWVLGSKEAGFYSRLRIDVQVILLLLSGMVLFLYLQSTVWNLPRVLYPYSLGRYAAVIVKFMLFGYVPVALIAAQLVYFREKLKEPNYLEAAVRDSYALVLIDNLRDFFNNRTIGVQLTALLVIFFLAGVGIVGAGLDGSLFVIYVFCVLFVALPAFFLFVSRGAYLNRILSATNAMASGLLTKDIPVKGKSPLALHAANLNNLREGVRVSVLEQAKSERLKSELITNVSHDLRTPLTSIITYTDLLKDETLAPEERAKYVEILDRKSQRLKVLIEDLFEVSKMASGNVEVVRRHVDLNQLVQQASAEHAQDFADANLDVRLSLPEQPVYAMVDGQKWWRVLDNLLINALKYALPGTRVYIHLEQNGTVARLTMKNVAKYEIGGNTDELFERFKRGDESRQTEGSGLGLAIAQSIVELHGGKLDIEVDGDLFKVVIDLQAE